MKEETPGFGKETFKITLTNDMFTPKGVLEQMQKEINMDSKSFVDYIKPFHLLYHRKVAGATLSEEEEVALNKYMESVGGKIYVAMANRKKVDTPLYELKNLHMDFSLDTIASAIRDFEEGKKYYTPDIEDIRVGYECECRLPFHRDWLKEVISKYDAIYFSAYMNYLKDSNLRTPYLTKEQIEAEGWKELSYKSGKYDGRLAWEKGNYFLILYEDNNTKLKGRIVIMLKDVTLDPYTEFTSNGQVYLGKCPSINEFRTICKLLNI